MKVLKQILFMGVLAAGLAINASAQNNDGKKPPPKPDPPVVKAAPDKPPPTPKPKDPKKPGFAIAMAVRENETSV